jgi:salicylate hydroxylase
MPIQLLVAGGGIAGLSAGLACARDGAAVRVFERTPLFSEAGAGIQLGPNVTRILEGWSLGDAVARCAAAPEALVVRDAINADVLARMALRGAFEQKYGAPYLTIHRADLQHIILEAARGEGVDLCVNAGVEGVENLGSGHSVRALLAGGEISEGDALAACDGVWSTLRRSVVDDSPAPSTGHFAFRALAPQASLPQSLRSNCVTVWLAPRMHVVAYPVRAGEQLNVVALVEPVTRLRAEGWETAGAASDLAPAMCGLCPQLQQLVEAMPAWGLWPLHDRQPVRGAHEMARGRVALLGDAAHPMFPYLAQGAGMAIEDAQCLAEILADATAPKVPDALQRYAQARWRRCAMVQQRARRNATIFHASGPLRVARNTAMGLLGERLLDQPWLYAR